MSDPHAWSLAHAVGAVGEAERAGCRTVGTEHLLLAALADSAVRWAFRTVGVDLQQVQQEVDEVNVGRRRRPQSEGITPDAADAVVHAGAGSDLLDEDEPDVPSSRACARSSRAASSPAPATARPAPSSTASA